MFKNKFQGGPFFEVFSSQGRNPSSEWKLTGPSSAIRKEFDKDVKSYVFVLEGNSSTIKMTLPKDEKQTLGLIQQYLVFQIFAESGRGFSIDLGVSDVSQVRRHIFLSSSHKEATSTPLHVRIPLVSMKRGQWVNFCLDLVSLVGNAFHGATFHAIEQITLSAACKIRKIFTLKHQPPDPDQEALSSTAIVEPIPRSLQISTGDISVVTQILRLSLLSGHETRAARVKSGKPSSASSLSSRRMAHTAATATTASASAGKKKAQSAGKEKTKPPPPELVASEPRPIKNQSKAVSTQATKTNKDSEKESSVYSYVSPPHSAKHRGGGGTSQPGDAGTEPVFPADQTTAFPSVEDDFELNSSRGTDSLHGSCRGATLDEDFLNDDGREEEESDDEIMERLVRAETKRSSHVVSRMNEVERVGGTARESLDRLNVIPPEMRLSDDYDWRNYQSSSGSPTSPLNSTDRLPGNIVIQDDSIEDVIVDDDGEGDSLSSLSDEGLTMRTASVEWQLGASHSMAASRSGELNARGAMGGPISPPLVLPTERGAEAAAATEERHPRGGVIDEDDEEKSETDGEEELDLLYDPCLNCYYDPSTHKYYELA